MYNDNLKGVRTSVTDIKSHMLWRGNQIFTEKLILTMIKEQK